MCSYNMLQLVWSGSVPLSLRCWRCNAACSLFWQSTLWHLCCRWVLSRPCCIDRNLTPNSSFGPWATYLYCPLSFIFVHCIYKHITSLYLISNNIIYIYYILSLLLSISCPVPGGIRSWIGYSRLLSSLHLIHVLLPTPNKSLRLTQIPFPNKAIGSFDCLWLQQALLPISTATWCDLNSAKILGQSHWLPTIRNQLWILIIILIFLIPAFVGDRTSQSS